MKIINLFAFAVGILSIGLLSSCESKDGDVVPVSISFDKPTALDSVYTNEVYTVTGKVNAEGQIKMIQFYSNYFFQDQESEVELAGTKITNVTGNPVSFSINVPGITKNTTIKVKVTDINGNVTTSSAYTIKELKMNIVRYAELTLGGWNSNFGSCLDVETGTPMSGGAVDDATLKPKIDLFFDDAKLGNVDLDSVYYDNISRLSDTGIRYAKTSFTSADFDAMRRDVLFANLTATSKIVSIAPGDVVFFIAKSGKKGLLRVAILTEPQGDLVLDEIIQK